MLQTQRTTQRIASASWAAQWAAQWAVWRPQKQTGPCAWNLERSTICPGLPHYRSCMATVIDMFNELILDDDYNGGGFLDS